MLALFLNSALSLAAQAGGNDFDIPTHKKVLANGMTVIVAPDPSTPLVAVRLFYKVGSRNEQHGLTGMAHLFEHMMFNGAKKYGPKRFDAVLEAAGGSGNAFTTTDFTCYTTQVPPASLPTVLDLESDRMISLDIAKHILLREIQVVLEERRSSLEDNPLSLLRTTLVSNMYQAHPYRWPVLGWASDVRSAQVRDCVEFFKAYYAPNNAILVLAGDVDPVATLTLVEQQFGALPRGTEIRSNITQEPPRLSETRVLLRRKYSHCVLNVGFLGGRASDPDLAAVELLGEILVNSTASRLHRRLVQREQIATSVQFRHDRMIDPEPLSFEVHLPPGKDTSAAQIALFDELAILTRDGVTESELELAKTGCTTKFLRSLQTLGSRATELGRFELVTGDHRRLLALPAAYESATAADVQAVASRYLQPHRATIAILQPEEASKQ